MSKSAKITGAPAPCPVLASLYKSDRPPVQLAATVNLSPVILSCDGTHYKDMLAENWGSKAEDIAVGSADRTGTAAPAFNPAAAEYNELARRLSLSSAMQRWSSLSMQSRHLEKQLSGLTGEAKEAQQQQLEELQQQLADAQTALTELQASFEPDPLSLVPWMNAMFAMADAGCSSFDAGSQGWPPQPVQVPLTELLGPEGTLPAVGGPAALSSWLYGGAEKVLGVFKRRYEAERGPGRVSIFTRLAINCLGDHGPDELAATVEAAVDKSRRNILGPEGVAAGASLDLVQLHWLDYKECDFMPVLMALASLARGHADLAAAADGSAGGDQSRKVSAVGLVDPPLHAVVAALRAGVPLACVTITYNLLDVSAAPVLQLCRDHGVKVFASGALAYGLINEAYLGVAAPDTATSGGAGPSPGAGAAAEAVGPDNLAAGLALVARYGGWARFQRLLHCLKVIADRHKVSMQAVALRWCIDQGTFPIIAARWTADSGPWATFGHTYGLQQVAEGADQHDDQSDSSSSEDQTTQQVQSDGTGSNKAKKAAVIPGGPGPFVPGVDGQLFQVASFLDVSDLTDLREHLGV